MAILNGLFGLAVLLGIAVLASRSRRRINWRLVASGFGLQFVFAVLVLRGGELGRFFAPLGWPKAAFEGISTAFVRLLGFSTDGAKFVFGDLALGPGTEGNLGYFFAFQALPTIIFFASLMAVLYHLGIMQRIVQAMAWVMARLMGTSGAESLANTANIFVGQTEAPLLIRPFLSTLTQSELLTVMVGGMCTIAGGVMAAYVQMLGYSYAEAQGVPLEEGQIRFAAQLLGASIMAAPAGLAISKILLPEDSEPLTKGTVRVNVEKRASNVIESAAVGAADGLKLALNVGAMLISFIAADSPCQLPPGGDRELTGLNGVAQNIYGEPLSLKLLFGIVLQFLTFAMGVPWQEAMQVGSLIRDQDRPQ